jgi:hypothetical protein
MADKPTTGDERLDRLVQEKFTEAIAITRQVLADRHPETVMDYEEAWLGKTCALIAVQLWPIFGGLFAEGVSLDLAEGIVPDGE